MINKKFIGEIKVLKSFDKVIKTIYLNLHLQIFFAPKKNTHFQYIFPNQTTLINIINNSYMSLSHSKTCVNLLF